MPSQQSAFDVHKSFRAGDASGHAADIDRYLATVHDAPIWKLSREARLAMASIRAGYQAGFAQVDVEPVMVPGRDADAWRGASNADFHLQELVKEGGLAADAAEQWLAGIERLAANGEFLGVATVVNLVATKA